MRRVPWGDVAADDVRDLYDDYAALLDAGEYDAWLELFTDDATYQAIARENVERGLELATMRADSRAMLADRLDARRRHAVLRPADDSALRRRDPAGRGGGRHGRRQRQLRRHRSRWSRRRRSSPPPASYDDVVVATPDGVRFARKVAVYDAPLVNTSLIVPL